MCDWISNLSMFYMVGTLVLLFIVGVVVGIGISSERSGDVGRYKNNQIRKQFLELLDEYGAAVRLSMPRMEKSLLDSMLKIHSTSVMKELEEVLKTE